MAEADALVWKALASPHRRAILDLLKEGPKTTGDLDAAMPDLGRFSVMQHLRVLESAGLVLVRREGRHRFNHLNPVPIRQVYERWVSKLAGRDARAAVALKRFVEGREAAMTARTVKIESEIRIQASPERVFRAMTTEQGQWYPHTYGGERVKRIVFEERVGGLVYEDWGSGAGHLYGTVAHYDPPRVVGLRSGLGNAIALEQWAILEPDGDATILKHSTITFGDITDEMAESIRAHGDLARFGDALRGWCEQPERAKARRR